MLSITCAALLLTIARTARLSPIRQLTNKTASATANPHFVYGVGFIDGFNPTPERFKIFNYINSGGCHRLKGSGYGKKICKGLSQGKWQCRMARPPSSTRNISRAVSHSMCPDYVPCICQDTTFPLGSQYDDDKCEEIMTLKVDRRSFLKPPVVGICPVYREVCEHKLEICHAHSRKETCGGCEDADRNCVADFPSFQPEFFEAFNSASESGCWGRVQQFHKPIATGGGHVLVSILQYLEKSRCCAKEVESGVFEYKWLRGKDLSDSTRPWLDWKSVCDGKNGWHHASMAKTKKLCVELGAQAEALPSRLAKTRTLQNQITDMHEQIEKLVDELKAAG